MKELNQLVASLVQNIRTVCQPEQIILFAEKRTMTTGKLKALSLCVTVPDGTDCHALRPQLHLVLSADLPVSLSVYTATEWESLRAYPGSYASWIARKGQVIYEPQT